MPIMLNFINIKVKYMVTYFTYNKNTCTPIAKYIK